MQNSEKVFLAVTEEMSFSKAANRMFLTQQCVSDHIKRLEEAYNTTLFIRRPNLKLTETGETVANNLRRISSLEENMKKEIQGIENGTHGNFTLGINPTRARILLPRILRKYYSEFPYVTFSFLLDDTHNMEKMLLRGKINMLLGINASNNPDFSYLPVKREDVYMIASLKFLSKFIDVKRFKQANQICRIGPEELNGMTIISNKEDSTLIKLVNNFLEYNKINMHTAYTISDYDTQIEMCSNHLCAAFCPSLILTRVFEHNLYSDGDEAIKVFKVNKFLDSLNIDLIYHKSFNMPQYVRIFVDMLREEFVNKIELLDNYTRVSQ